MSDLIAQAQEYATSAHQRIHHLRKYTRKPYDVHLKAVADLVGGIASDPAMIAAAWLHDVVEDTPATLDDVERSFGSDVAALVEQLTDVSRPSTGNRAARAAINRAHTAKASPRAKTIKLADLIDNCRDICAHDVRFAETYLAEMAALLDVLTEGDGRLLREARAVLNECSVRLGLGGAASIPTEQEGIGASLPPNYPAVLLRLARTFVADDLAGPLAGAEPEQPPASRITREGQVVPGTAPLSDVVEVLTRHERCFVGDPEGLTGVIRRQDIRNPVARMWLFGLITITEMFFTERIRELWPDGSWARLMTPGRLGQAEKLQAERLRIGQATTLLECIQLADKAGILLRNPEQLAALGFASRRAGEKVVRDLQSLRNNLAHSQDIVSHDWPQIVRLARRLESLLPAERHTPTGRRFAQAHAPGAERG